jgi:hypothetical protein
VTAEPFSRKDPLQQESDALGFLLKAIVPADGLRDSC